MLRSLAHRKSWVGVALVASAIIALIGLASWAGPSGTDDVAPTATGAPSIVAPSGATPIRIGAVFPTSGNAAGLAGQELAGVRIAADLVNEDGGVGGRPIVLDVRDLERADAAPAVMAALRAEGVHVVIGAYSSDLSIAASAAADAEGLVYWEAGAVADRLTGRGLPLVFRVGASGTDLGSNSARFAATELAPRLDTSVGSLRVAIVNADDDYARSVADAAERTATEAGLDIVARTGYDLTMPDWPALIGRLKSSRPDVIILASHIPDGVAFRRAMLAGGLRTKALIGSTMAECDPDFAGDLGPDAIGIFASDRPTGGFQPDALAPTERATYDRFAAAWARSSASTSQAQPTGGSDEYGSADGAVPGDGPSGSGDPGYQLTGPDHGPTSGAPEEALSGFSAAWPLFHDVLPAAAASGGLDAERVASAARGLDLPVGAMPNGAGIRFSADPASLGQNVRAAAVIWQWQAVRTYAFVWPATYATGSIRFVPLPR